MVLPIRNGHLKTGTWQQVVAINHDNHPRKRTIEITIIGTAEKKEVGKGLKSEVGMRNAEVGKKEMRRV
jgi:hypothetical protein